jgi:hypothetical protein
MSVSIRLDTAEFKPAMREYLQATKKDSAHVINRQMLNFSIKGRQLTKIAERADIESIQSESWFWKVVSSVIAKTKGGAAGKSAYQAQWAADAQLEHLAETGRKGAFKLDKTERANLKQASVVGRALLKKRLRGIGFLRFFFLSVAQAISAKANVGKALAGKAFTGMTAQVVPATPASLMCAASATYPYERRTAKTAKRAEALLQAICNKALPATIQDMRQYTERQMAKRAAQFSGRRT